MKFSTIALLLSAIIAPSAAEYVCHSDASFNSDVDSMPSPAAQKYLGSALVDAFNEAYAGVDGITMDYDDVEGFDTDPSAAVLLREGANLERRNRGRSGRRRSRSTGGYNCNLCKTYDDDDATASLSAIDFGVALASSKEHLSWEKLFCAKGRANTEFSSMTDCKIDLSNCHDDEVDNVRAIPNKSGIPSQESLRRGLRKRRRRRRKRRTRSPTNRPTKSPTNRPPRVTSKPLINGDDDDGLGLINRPEPLTNRPNPFPDRNRKQSFPELVGMTGEEAKIYLKRYGKNGSSRKDGGICLFRNIDYNRVCWEEDENGLIIYTPFSG